MSSNMGFINGVFQHNSEADIGFPEKRVAGDMFLYGSRDVGQTGLRCTKPDEFNTGDPDGENRVFLCVVAVVIDLEDDTYPGAGWGVVSGGDQWMADDLAEAVGEWPGCRHRVEFINGERSGDG